MAVADAAQDSKAPTPPEVITLNRIEMFGDPYGGGWMNWPAGDVKRLTIARVVTDALRSASNVKPGEFVAWQESHLAYAKTYDDILSLREAMAANNGD